MKRAAIEIKQSSIHRYGVFAMKTIKRGTVIEECPILLVDEKSTGLEKYKFDWKKEEAQSAAIALGYGTLYNHSKEPNASAEQDYLRNLIVVSALKPIPSGEEILISYGKNWFEDKGLKEIKPRSTTKKTLIVISKALAVIAAIIFIKVGLHHQGT